MNYAGKFDATFSADGPGLHPQGRAHVETMTKHATHAPADAIIVPDSQLLFNGDFKRVGRRPVLSHGRPRTGAARLLQGREARGAVVARRRAPHRRSRQRPDRPHRIRAGRRQRGRRQGDRPCHQALGQRDHRPQRRLDHSEQRRQRRKGRRRPVRLRFDARHHLHRRHRVRPVVECANGAQRNGLRPQRVEQFVADQPGGRHHLLRRRRDGQARRHEGRYAGRDHGHPRHRRAGRDRFQRTRHRRRAGCEIPGSGRAGRHHRFLYPVRQEHADADRDRQPGRPADQHQPGPGRRSPTLRCRRTYKS